MRSRTSLRLFLSLSLTAAIAPALSTSPAVAAPTDSAAPVALNWSSCPSAANTAAQCTEISVPRDYSHPERGTIALTVSRVTASGQVKGTIAGNPGGPGGDALDIFSLVGLPDDVREHYDLIAVEPRGLTWGTPLDCPVAATPIVTAGDLYAGCESTYPGYVSTVTTDNTARDLNEVRKSLGIDQLNLYGVSYGGVLMATYATLFPEHTDHLLLDSSASPDQRWFGLGATRKQARIDGLNAMFSWLSDHDEDYHLGTTPLQVYRRWAAVVAGPSGVQLPTEPPAAQDADLPASSSVLPGELGLQLTDAVTRLQWRTGTLLDSARSWTGDTDATVGVFTGTGTLMTGLYDQHQWPVIGETLRDAEYVDEATDPDTEEDDADAAAQLARARHTMLVERAIFCNENTVAPDLSRLPSVLETQFTGGDLIRYNEDVLASGNFCTGWPAPTTPTYPSGAGLRRAPLNIGYSHDTAVTASGAPDMQRAMGGELITVAGYSHAVLAKDPDMVADKVEAYFA